MPDDPPPAPDAPLPEDVPTDEAFIDHEAVSLYRSLIPQRPVMASDAEE